ncbi:hypothetical protein H5410_032964 [Solanum commersonii]|uniref:Uncharacterized protein n=1 Tax=Solanum commersonii TaxID=4109 RepID=A0A9J5YMC6_SOLCO|nr:hypothetical protein H5410_032964 [Solanum commersonii]
MVELVKVCDSCTLRRVNNFFRSWRLIHRGGRKQTSARRRPLNLSGVRETSDAGGASHHCFAVEYEREATLASGEENKRLEEEKKIVMVCGVDEDR